MHVDDMLELAATLRNGRSAFEKNGAQLVGQVRARTHQPRADPVQRLDVKLLLRLQFNKAHCRARSSLGDGFRIPVVILVGLHIGANIFRRHQPNLVSKVGQKTPQMMRTATRFHGDNARRQLRGETHNRLGLHSPEKHNLPGRIQSRNAAAVLAKVNSQHHDRHGSSFSVSKHRHPSRCLRGGRAIP